MKKWLMMWTGLPVFLLWVTACHPVEEKGIDFAKGPWLQNSRQDGMTILWETQEPEKGFVEYGRSRKMENRTEEVTAEKLHTVVIRGLEPGTAYYYRVVSGGRKGRIFTFHTAVRKETPFTLAVYGDNKYGPFNHEKIAGLILSKKPGLVINNGDLVNRGQVYVQWEKLFFGPIRELAARIPVYTVMGNHENNARYYYDYFDPPLDTIPWYSFDYGNAHFIVLNSEEMYLMDTTLQVEWLKKDLEEHRDAVWKIVNLHVPPFTCGGNYYARDRLKIKQLLVPIFIEYGVDLVMSGHDHDYERTRPIGSKNGGDPVTFIVCGNGGTPLRHIYPREFTRHAERVYGFTLLHFDGSRLHFQAYNIHDTLIDEFTLDKSDPASMAAYRRETLFYEDVKDASQEVAGYYREGHRAAKKRLWEQAIAFFQKAIAADTTCYQAMGEMAKCYAGMGDYDRALKYGMEAQRHMPTLPYAYEAIIRSYRKQGNYKKALRWCGEMYRYTSDSPDAYLEQADVYLAMADTAQALKALLKAHEILPNDPEIQFEIAGICDLQGKTEEAVKFYRGGLFWYLDPEKDENCLQAEDYLRRHQNIQ